MRIPTFPSRMRIRLAVHQGRYSTYCMGYISYSSLFTLSPVLVHACLHTPGFYLPVLSVFPSWSWPLQANCHKRTRRLLFRKLLKFRGKVDDWKLDLEFNKICIKNNFIVHLFSILVFESTATDKLIYDGLFTDVQRSYVNFFPALFLTEALIETLKILVCIMAS